MTIDGNKVTCDDESSPHSIALDAAKMKSPSGAVRLDAVRTWAQAQGWRTVGDNDYCPSHWVAVVDALIREGSKQWSAMGDAIQKIDRAAYDKARAGWSNIDQLLRTTLPAKSEPLR